MFDVGFSEMLVIGIVALVVIGPERLPKVARTLGHLMGRAQRYVNDVKRDIDREMQIDELKKLQAEMQDAARSIESSVTTQVSEVKSELDKAETSLNAVAAEADLTRLDDPLGVPAADATSGAASIPAANARSAEAEPVQLAAQHELTEPPLSETLLPEPPPHIEPDYAEGAMIAANGAAAARSVSQPAADAAPVVAQSASTSNRPAA